MSAATDAAPGIGRSRRLGARVWAAVVAGWGVLSGIAPHVLHHIGPLAGAALLAGFGGTALFFALGLGLSVPMLRRLHRRFRTWVAPALAVVAFTVLFAVSSLVIAPLIAGASEQPPPPASQQPAGHASHHVG